MRALPPLPTASPEARLALARRDSDGGAPRRRDRPNLRPPAQLRGQKGGPHFVRVRRQQGAHAAAPARRMRGQDRARLERGRTGAAPEPARHRHGRLQPGRRDAGPRGAREAGERQRRVASARPARPRQLAQHAFDALAPARRLARHVGTARAHGGRAAARLPRRRCRAPARRQQPERGARPGGRRARARRADRARRGDRPRPALSRGELRP